LGVLLGIAGFGYAFDGFGAVLLQDLSTEIASLPSLTNFYWLSGS
jgi:hypothetical protein